MNIFEKTFYSKSIFKTLCNYKPKIYFIACECHVVCLIQQQIVVWKRLVSVHLRTVFYIDHGTNCLETDYRRPWQELLCVGGVNEYETEFKNQQIYIFGDLNYLKVGNKRFITIES